MDKRLSLILRCLTHCFLRRAVPMHNRAWRKETGALLSKLPVAFPSSPGWSWGPTGKHRFSALGERNSRADRFRVDSWQMYCQGPPQGSPALISSLRHGSTCQATYPSHSWCLVTLRELLSPPLCAPPCNQHIPEHLGIFMLKSTLRISENKEQGPISVTCPGNMEMSWLTRKGNPTLPSLGG